jgi:hypothetical protein
MRHARAGGLAVLPLVGWWLDGRGGDDMTVMWLRLLIRPWQNA